MNKHGMPKQQKNAEESYKMLQGFGHV